MISLFFLFSHMNSVFLQPNTALKPNKVEKRLNSYEKRSKICQIMLSTDISWHWVKGGWQHDFTIFWLNVTKPMGNIPLCNVCTQKSTQHLEEPQGKICLKKTSYYHKHVILNALLPTTRAISVSYFFALLSPYFLGNSSKKHGTQ